MALSPEMMGGIMDAAVNLTGAMTYSAPQQQLALQIDQQKQKQTTMYIVVGIVLVAIAALIAIFFSK